MKKHFDHLAQYMPGLLEKPILDLGSGRGKFVLDVTKRGGHVIGLEKNQEYIDIAMQSAKETGVHIHVAHGSAEDLPFDDESFAFVNIAEVIEHVDDPNKMLSEVYRILKSNGMAYLSVPNRFGIKDPHFHLLFVNWLPRQWCNFYLGLRNKHKDYNQKAGRQNLAEMHYFTYKAIAALLDVHGFEVVDIRILRLKNMVQNKILMPFILLLYQMARFCYFGSFHILIKK